MNSRTAAHAIQNGLEEALRAIRERADTLRFGTITLTLHDGKLTQMEVSEKRRFGP